MCNRYPAALRSGAAALTLVAVCAGLLWLASTAQAQTPNCQPVNVAGFPQVLPQCGQTGAGGQQTSSGSTGQPSGSGSNCLPVFGCEPARPYLPGNNSPGFTTGPNPLQLSCVQSTSIAIASTCPSPSASPSSSGNGSALSGFQLPSPSQHPTPSIAPSAGQGSSVCTQWNVNGTWQLSQSNGVSPTLTLQQTGTAFTGSLTFTDGDRDHAGLTANTYTVSGSVTSIRLDFNVTGPNKQDGTPVNLSYAGIISAGSISGGSIIDASSNKVLGGWSATGAATCGSQASAGAASSSPSSTASPLSSGGGQSGSGTTCWDGSTHYPPDDPCPGLPTLPGAGSSPSGASVGDASGAMPPSPCTDCPDSRWAAQQAAH